MNLQIEIIAIKMEPNRAVGIVEAYGASGHVVFEALHVVDPSNKASFTLLDGTPIETGARLEFELKTNKTP